MQSPEELAREKIVALLQRCGQPRLRGPAFEDWLNKYVPRGGPPNLHPEQPPPGAACARAGGGHGLEGKIDNR
jgi:hypothetical protein